MADFPSADWYRAALTAISQAMDKCVQDCAFIKCMRISQAPNVKEANLDVRMKFLEPFMKQHGFTESDWVCLIQSENHVETAFAKHQPPLDKEDYENLLGRGCVWGCTSYLRELMRTM